MCDLICTTLRQLTDYTNTDYCADIRCHTHCSLCGYTSIEYRWDRFGIRAMIDIPLTLFALHSSVSQEC